MSYDGRDVSLDAVRGVAIVSMTVAHVATGTVLVVMTHSWRWINGAQLFVLLSGFVLGMVQRRRIVRIGERAASLKVLRRVGTLIAVQVTLLVLALATGFVDPAVAGGWGGALFAAVTLRLNPAYVDILSLYIVFMVGSLLVFALLKRGRPLVVVAISVAVYAAGLAFPEAGTLPEWPGREGFLNLMSWQALFVLGLCSGWHYKRVMPWLRSRPVVAGATAATGALWLLANTWNFTGFADSLVRPGIFDHNSLGVATIVYAVAASIALAALARGRDRLTGPLRTIGRRSLESYAMLTALVMLLPVRPAIEAGAREMLFVPGVLGALWAWAKVRDAWDARADSRAETPATAALRT